MKTVLFVDDEKTLLESVRSGFLNNSETQLLTAENGRAALDVLGKNNVDLIVTDLRMPVMDGFELLARLNAEYSKIPVVVMSAYGTSEIEDKLKALGITGILDKPLDYDKMLKIVEDSLASGPHSGSVFGISLSNFLQLIEMEEKTCLLEVESDGKGSGFFYLEEGILFDAVYKRMKGELAALEMLSWESVKLTFRTLPVKRIRQSIQRGLMSLLMEAANSMDEKTDASMDDSGDSVSATDSMGIEEEDSSRADNVLAESQTAGYSETVLKFEGDVEAEPQDNSKNREFHEEENSRESEEAFFGDAPGGNPTPTDEKESDDEATVARPQASDGKSGEVANPDGNAPEDADEFQPVQIKEGESRMSTYKGLLKEMSDEIDGVIAAGLFGMDGIAVATHNPEGANTDAFGAKFAMVMRLVEKSSGEIQNVGAVEENLVQSEGAWIVTKFVNPKYYVGIIVNRDSTLGNVRLVANKFLPKFANALG